MINFLRQNFQQGLPFCWLDDNGAGKLEGLFEGRGDGKRWDLEVTVEEVGGAAGTRLRQLPQAEHLLTAVLKAEDLAVAVAAVAGGPSLLPCRKGLNDVQLCFIANFMRNFVSGNHSFDW